MEGAIKEFEAAFEPFLKEWSTRPGEPDYTKEECIQIRVNGKEKKIFKCWLRGNGRGAKSKLAKLLLQTREGSHATTELKLPKAGFRASKDLTLEAKQALCFDMILVWLLVGDDVFTSVFAGCRLCSRELYALAAYLGLVQFQGMIEKNNWDTDRIGNVANVGDVSKDHQGVVYKFVRWKGWGYILDKETRKQVWFHKDWVVQSAQGPTFQVGEECLYDATMTGRGKRPNDPKAVNIRTLSGTPFKKHQVEMFC
ncbi:expressed unknown protein [Seminavis robusta]|uniref:CSD domain-containing protein n=1 Tax=Seminavis robusta TaxID=568900 RepID=A0A9N8D891_9STRA|nr:expressed unknown protein [Seminavis robusta]|eukprot:Sro13_g009970.1 n/a (254) ;mRNA; f:79673-80434